MPGVAGMVTGDAADCVVADPVQVAADQDNNLRPVAKPHVSAAFRCQTTRNFGLAARRM